MGLDHWFWKQRSFFIYDFDRDDVERWIEIIGNAKKVDIDPRRLQSIWETITVLRNDWMVHDLVEKKTRGTTRRGLHPLQRPKRTADVCNSILKDQGIMK